MQRRPQTPESEGALFRAKDGVIHLREAACFSLEAGNELNEWSIHYLPPFLSPRYEPSLSGRFGEFFKERKANPSSLAKNCRGLSDKASESGRDELRVIAEIWDQAGSGDIPQSSLDLVATKNVVASQWIRLYGHISEDVSTIPRLQLGVLVGRLFRQIKQGNHEAADLYLDLVMMMIHELNRLQETAPDIYRQLLCWRVRWPGILSNHPYFADHAMAPRELGHGYPFEVDPTCRWDPAMDSRYVAMRLIMYIQRLREIIGHYSKDTLASRKTLAPLLRDALALGELRDDTLRWWEFGYARFLDAYNRPEEVERFSRWITAASHRKSPGRIRARIRDKLYEAFASIASYRKSGGKRQSVPLPKVKQ